MFEKRIFVRIQHLNAINNQNVSNKILNVLTSQNRTFVECETVDHKLCKILFDNWPESQ